MATGRARRRTTDSNRRGDVFVRDRSKGTTTRVSLSSAEAQGNGFVQGTPAVSFGGRYVAFASAASNVVPRDTNKGQDVFVRDRVAGTTTRASVGDGGVQANNNGGLEMSPTISGGGRYVALTSFASNLVAEDRNGTYDVSCATFGTRPPVASR